MIRRIIKFLKRGLFFLPRYAQGKLKKEKMNIKDIKREEGGVVEIGGEKRAVYKRENGEVVKLSPACTHLGCNVVWDKSDPGWTCPCHGSHFSPEGEVQAGPAQKGLKKYE